MGDNSLPGLHESSLRWSGRIGSGTGLPGWSSCRGTQRGREPRKRSAKQVSVPCIEYHIVHRVGCGEKPDTSGHISRFTGSGRHRGQTCITGWNRTRYRRSNHHHWHQRRDPGNHGLSGRLAVLTGMNRTPSSARRTGQSAGIRPSLLAIRTTPGTATMRLLRENGYFFIGGTVATAILIAVVLELLFRY